MATRFLVPPAVVLAALLVTAGAYAQGTPFDRLPGELLDVVPPSQWVRGAPGEMTIQRLSCPSVPMAEVRRRIVDVAVQEWGFFGFSMVDETAVPDFGGTPAERRFSRRINPEEAARVAESIAGYWAVTPEGAMMIGRQNEVWSGPVGIGARWRDPWSAAFISWVMCAAGLSETRLFQRAIAHWVYIDQAIHARDGSASQGAFLAYDAGETSIAPGDLLCTARRPMYRSIAERRRQIGGGAGTHCDVVVKLDEAGERIFAIGGNVRGTVAMKLIPAARGPGGNLRPSADAGRRPVFAHLKLRTDAIETDALDGAPTIRALACAAGLQPRPGIASVITAVTAPAVASC